MKIVEALKKIEQLKMRCEDLRGKIAKHSSDYDNESQVYPDQKSQVKKWIQSCHDSVVEMEKLSLQIQYTNLLTEVPIEIGKTTVYKSIAAWILRRRLLADMEFKTWGACNDVGKQAYKAKGSSGAEVEVQVRRHYDSEERDEKMAEYRSEPSTIDAALEVVNAVTDLLEVPLPVAQAK